MSGAWCIICSRRLMRTESDRKFEFMLFVQPPRLGAFPALLRSRVDMPFHALNVISGPRGASSPSARRLFDFVSVAVSPSGCIGAGE